ncbi:MAG: hypothetical protein H7Z17_08010 [Fuerstia sp.]|nr:hypothetical protein [Fuerstiella sp.]
MRTKWENSFRFHITEKSSTDSATMQGKTNSKTVPPAWLRWFVNDAVRGILDREAAAPVGCHFFHDLDADVWEVSLFLSRTEVYGGAADGKQVPGGLQIDVAAVAKAFDFAPAVYWQAEKFSSEDELGNHLSFEGVARGVHVWLRILQSAPDWAGPGRLVHAESGRVDDIW